MGKRHNRRRVKPTWQFLWATSDKSCFWCSQYVTPAEASLEHLLPLSVGGPDRIEFTRLACKDCNNRRGDDISPWRMARVMSALGWNPRPLHQACPDILAIASSFPFDIGVTTDT